MDFIATFFRNYGLFSLFLLTGILVLGFYIRYRRAKFPLRSVVKILGMVVLVFVLTLFLNGINAGYIGYGYCSGRFKVLACGDDVLWGIDEFAGVNDNPKIYRIQGLHLQSGAKLFRKLIRSHFEYIGYKKRLMWAYIEENGKNVIGMDPFTGKTRLTTDEYNLMKRVPEFSKVICQSSPGTLSPLATIASGRGLRLLDEESDAHPAGGYSSDSGVNENEFELSSDRLTLNKHKVITFGNAENQNLTDDRGNILNDELTFYSGQFLLFDERNEKLVTMSYTTPQNKEFVLRYLSKDGKLVWKVRQSDLAVGDVFNPEPDFEKAFIYNENLIFVFEGFVFSLDSFNGRLNWMTRM